MDVHPSSGRGLPRRSRVLSLELLSGSFETPASYDERPHTEPNAPKVRGFGSFPTGELARVPPAPVQLSAPVRNYGDVFGRASGRGSEPFVFDFSEENSEIFSSEGPLKGRSSFLIPS